MRYGALVAISEVLLLHHNYSAQDRNVFNSRRLQLALVWRQRSMSKDHIAHKGPCKNPSYLWIQNAIVQFQVPACGWSLGKSKCMIVEGKLVVFLVMIASILVISAVIPIIVSPFRKHTLLASSNECRKEFSACRAVSRHVSTRFGIMHLSELL